MLGRLIEKKSGQNLLEYLRYRLFEPLEFHNPEWLHCPMGHTVAANSLMINVDEMGNLGQMLCNGGVYKNLGTVSGDTRVQLPSGQYIVVVGGDSFKVIL